MVTNSLDIVSLNFEVLVDISVLVPVVSFHNQSSGPNLAGCTWIAAVNVNGIPVHQGVFSTPDLTGAWTNYTIPETLPQPGRNIIWGEYTFSLTVKDSTGHQFTETHTVSITKPNGNKPGSNYGEADFEITAKCDQARLLAEDRTNVSYQRSTKPYLPISQTFTLAFPATEQGTFPAPKVITDFANALIPISVSGSGYTAILEVVNQYKLSDNVFLQIKYRHKESFTVSCHVDLCQLQCEYDALLNKAQDKCDNGLTQKLLLINGKINQALMGKMQPLCGIDVGKLVDEIKEIGGFDCDCNCGDGINPMISASTSTMDCNGVIACINTLLGQLDMKCLTSSINWTALGLLGKFQFIINQLAKDCDTCTAPTDVAFDINTQILSWTDTANSPLWRVEYKLSTDSTYNLYTATAPYQANATQWQVDMSGLNFLSNGTYSFRVSGQCPNGTFSTYAVSPDYTLNICYTVLSFDGTITP